MKPRIFISAVTQELGQTRQLAANVLTRLGYDPVWQDIFGTEAGDLRQVLRDKIDDCNGVVHLVGCAYGAEPPQADPEFGRVSYTQFEFLYARKKGKRTWVFFAEEGYPLDKPLGQLDLPPEPSGADPAAYQAERPRCRTPGGGGCTAKAICGTPPPRRRNSSCRSSGSRTSSVDCGGNSAPGNRALRWRLSSC